MRSDFAVPVALALIEMPSFLSGRDFYDGNGTDYNNYPSSEHMSGRGPMGYDYDDVLRLYRSDTRKREPQFIGFDIQDDNIEVD